MGPGKVEGVAFSIYFSMIMVGSLILLGVSEAQTVPAIYVFGDSLVDVGNNNHLKISLAKANFPHNGVDFPGGKPTGRFCNGKNAADLLAEKVGLPTSPPYLAKKGNDEFLKGVSFASGGAGIFNSTDELFRQSIPLTKQVDYYSGVYQSRVQRLGAAGAQNHFSKSIFAVVIGSNDLLGYFNPGSSLPKKNTPQQYLNLMISTFNGVLKRLHGFGARKFLVTGIGAIGCCPKQRSENSTGECNVEANYWSNQYNVGVKSMLQGLKAELKDINYSFFDTYGVFVQFLQTPATYGFKEVKSACCGLGNLRAKVPCVPISEYCSNRTDHLFWDLYHPTEAAARIFVDLIFNGNQQFVTPINVKQLIAI